MALGEYAPDAYLRPQWPQHQIPEDALLTDLWWHTGHSCHCFCWASTFLILLRTTTPYLAPNLPALPTFTVLFDIGNHPMIFFLISAPISTDLSRQRESSSRVIEPRPPFCMARKLPSSSVVTVMRALEICSSS